MNYVYVILGILLVTALFYLYYYIVYSMQTTLSADQKHLMENVNDIPFTNLDNPDSRRYSYSLWVYVNNPPQNSSTYAFFNVQDTTLSYNFGLSVSDKGQFKYYMNDTNKEYKTIVTNFPFQKWVYIVISVDSNIVDFYVDGKLAKSDKNNNAQMAATSKESTVVYGKNMDLYISQVARFPYPMDPQTVWNNYSSAVKSNSMNADGMKLVITKDFNEFKKLQLY